MKIFKNLFFVIVVLTVTMSCGGGKNKDLIPKEDLVNLLADLHILDAIATDYAINRQMTNLDSASIYSSILAKYNTTKEQFDVTMVWYSEKPKELAAIYDEVFGKLNKRHEDLEELNRFFSGKDSRVIYSNEKYRNFSGDSVSYPGNEIIKLEGAGEYFFDVRIRMLKSDMSRDPYIVISLLKSRKDTVTAKEIIRTPILKSNFSRDYQFNYVLEDSTFRYAKIVLPETINRDSLKHKDLQVSKIKALMRMEVSPEEKEK